MHHNSVQTMTRYTIVFAHDHGMITRLLHLHQYSAALRTAKPFRNTDVLTKLPCMEDA